MAEPALHDGALARQIAEAISRRLSEALADPRARSITLTRDEAVLTLGVVDGVIEHLDREKRP